MASDGKPKGFVLTPSRLGLGGGGGGGGNSGSTGATGGTGGGATNQPENTGGSVMPRPLFGGLKQSKLGAFGSSSLQTTIGSNKCDGDNNKSKEAVTKPPNFSFAPLSKPAEVSNKEDKPAASPFKPTSTGFGAKSDSDSSTSDSTKPLLSPPVFGQNLMSKVVLPAASAAATSTTSNSSTDNGSGPGGTTAANSSPSAAPVFGENLSEKVLLAGQQPTPAATATTPQEQQSAASPVNTPSTEQEAGVKSDMLFSSALTAAPKATEDEKKKTLREAAAEYTETQSANKRKYEEVTVVTGEEDESNVLQSNVKLYLFEREKRNWLERGRGSLRLNDTPNSSPGHLKSRLVMRTAGSLRVVLNTKLWPEMICERVNEKNVRISAWDDNVVKIFLISSSPKDTDKIFTALDHRINQLKMDKESGLDDDDDDDVAALSSDPFNENEAKPEDKPSESKDPKRSDKDKDQPSAKKLHTE